MRRLHRQLVDGAPRWLAVIAALGAALVLLAWVTGRLLTDRYAWSQWLWWIPTPAALAAAAIGLAASSRPALPPARRRRVIAWGAGLALVLGEFGLHEHRFLHRAPREPAGLKLVHWNLSESVDALHSSASQVIALGGDLTILTNDVSTRRDDRILEWLGEGNRPLATGPFTILSQLPIRQLRWLVAEKGMSVVLLEVDASVPLGRELVLYLVDLPSDPRRSRAEIARLARRRLDAVDAPAPDVVVGDLNITRGSASLGVLFPGFTHAYDQGGHGYGASFHRRFPLYHIDHVLLANTLRCVRYDLMDLSVARHDAQVAIIRGRD